MPAGPTETGWVQYSGRVSSASMITNRAGTSGQRLAALAENPTPTGTEGVEVVTVTGRGG